MNLVAQALASLIRLKQLRIKLKKAKTLSKKRPNFGPLKLTSEITAI